MSNKPVRILLVDDEEVIRVTLEAFLKDEGFEVLLAASGEECLDILAKEKVDLAIVDMRLPQMDGNIVILESIRLDPTLKFIIYTGSSGYALSPELTQAGLKPIQVLRKPLNNMDTLTQLINQTLSGESGKNSTPENPTG